MAYIDRKNMLALLGVVTTYTDPTHFKASSLVGYGDDFFKGYYVYVVWDAAGGGAAPQGEYLLITGYTSADGTITHGAFSEYLTVDDKVLIMHPALLDMFDDLAIIQALHLVPAQGSTENILIRDVVGNKTDPANEIANQSSIIGLIRAILADVTGLNGSAMRGTDSAALAAVCTETRLSQLDAANLPTSIGAIVTNVSIKLAGRAQMAVKTVDLQQAAGAYDLFTGAENSVILESLIFRTPVDCSDDSGGFTGISIQTDDATLQELISQANGVKANLTEAAQISWNGNVLLKVGKKVQLTIYGAAADAATVCEVIVKCRAVLSGGYLTV